MDVLSDVLNMVRLTGALYFDVDAGTPFTGESLATITKAKNVMPGAEHVIEFHVILSGGCWAALVDDSVPAERLGMGDIVVFPQGDANVLSSSRGARDAPHPEIYYYPKDGPLPFRLVDGGKGDDRTRFVCGYLGCNARPFNPLLASLPGMICARAVDGDTGWITDLLRVALAEGASQSAGGEIILSKLSELIFVAVIRRHLAMLPEDALGWLAGLRDPQVGQVLGLFHGRPAENWTLERLARETGQSRSRLASRFMRFVQLPPMQYLAKWRMQMAVRRLEDSTSSLAEVAAAVGYESEAAFKRTFKKHLGRPPGAWRKLRGRRTSPEARQSLADHS